eukprot:TRINITY_DN2099_c0_g1_i9.p1 TRINITY_DN2099_c0_g1~~TRINITY_DN2099_c0_g1_i9.p1  ORF type:complete len:130 (+),score=15.10 TRINITY_DN2099_c0_g1_i9:121-510(+)
MYNFGSPRVGNKRFAELYNEKVKDSWRIVNHRDIIPTVPRLMGYCHVAQPVYLAAGDFRDALFQANMEFSGDGYEGDLIGEYTPDVLVNEFISLYQHDPVWPTFFCTSVSSHTWLKLMTSKSERGERTH